MAVNITADQIVNSNDQAFSFFFTDLQEGQGLVFNLENNRWENAFIESAEEEVTSTTSTSISYPIYHSLRFDGSSYLSRTFRGATDSKRYTLSLWVKLSTISQNSDLFSTALSNITDYDHIRFDSTNQIRLFYRGGVDAHYATSSLFRDTSSWYHIVVKTDTTQSSRHEVYVNSVNQQLSLIAGSGISTNYVNDFNTAIQHTLGVNLRGGAYLNGYLANIHFIDGQALDASHFGQEISGVWVPKAYDPATSGDYGINGFHLDFADGIEPLDVNGSNVGAFRDKSGNNNHWKAN